MQVFAPSSDGTPITGATAVGPSSFYACCDDLIQGDPDYVDLDNEGIVTLNVAGSYGPGTCYLVIRYSWTGTVAPIVSFIEGSNVTGTATLTTSSGFNTKQFTGPSLAGGESLKIRVSNQHGNVGRTRISYIQLQVPNILSPDPLVIIQPTSWDDARAGGICSRTKFWIPGHDSVFINGRRYSRSMSNPPLDGDTNLP